MIMSYLNILYLTVVGGMFDNLKPMNWDSIKVSLNVMWKGLLAIFVVIAIIIIVVKVIQTVIIKITTLPDEDDK